MSDNQVKIVIVEDDEGHSILIERNLRRAGVNNPIRLIGNGREAIDYLQKEASDIDLASTLVLLDLNLPELDGMQILERMKSDARTKMVPIIVLTTTDNPKEVRRCYELGCNVYVTKPVEYDMFCESIKKLGFLVSIVKVPSDTEPTENAA